ncbi:helix-turn-helix domain-containing protein [Chelativorans sp. Marseille-P2723]|uniref:helix-turn-helix domain-containing protein n=1 Tax=Chelativorans sp. Marseille-P2723 TaxID=2709133 RepID=UPI00156F0C8A|nr:helix-turn-helix domain-containing protein [Chelativorans sp. Marseille-P2723]
MEPATVAAVADDRPVRPSAASAVPRCRTNSRRGLTDLSRPSYPPVEAACRVLDVLRAVNDLRIAKVNEIHEITDIPKSTVVRMLETLMAQGYVARDNMCGGYRVTRNVQELASGYDGVSRVIETARPFAIDLTRRINWPIGLGVPDGDAIAIQFWTGTISPWAHTNTVLGLRPDYHNSAMGRAYLAFCSKEEREMRIEAAVNEMGQSFTDQEKTSFRTILDRARMDGFAIRNPRTPPFRTITIGLPLREEGQVRALVSVSVFRTAVPAHELYRRVIQPVQETIANIEAALAFFSSCGTGAPAEAQAHMEPGF